MRTLEENFLESMKVEKDMTSIYSHQGNEENKPSSSDKNTKKKGILRMNIDKKYKDPTDMASMQREMKQLTNYIIDLKKNKGEGKKPLKLFMKKMTYFVPQLLTSGINIEDYAMDNFCHTHHMNRYERNCPKFINSFTAILTPSEPPKKDKKSEKEEEDEDQEEEEEDEGEEPPSHLNVL